MIDYDFMFKFIIVGNSSTGKSSLMIRFVNDEFNMLSEPTLGVEFGVKMVQAGGLNIKTQIWDTAGQENFRSLTRSYFRRCGYKLNCRNAGL
jgi:small GTP-binding protein